MTKPSIFKDCITPKGKTWVMWENNITRAWQAAYNVYGGIWQYDDILEAVDKEKRYTSLKNWIPIFQM